MDSSPLKTIKDQASSTTGLIHASDMQEPDQIPVWNKNGYQEDQVYNHFYAKEFREIFQLHQPKREEQHVKRIFIWQQDLIRPMQNGHPHHFWIDADR